MASNNNIQITELDFSGIKNNLQTFLQGQEVFQDYNFAGSALSVLLDILAYNTQYQAVYLNMVANEMFIDSAIQRNSVVSHAKLLNYTPKSAIAPTAFVNLTINGATGASYTIPQFTNFASEAIGGVNFNFVTIASTTVNIDPVTHIGQIQGLELKQGIPTTYTFTFNGATNPNSIFEIPDPNIDTTSLLVAVQQSSTNTAFNTYNLSKDFSVLDGSSLVYFLQEGMDGNYQIYFGDGILGKQLTDGNQVVVTYISTDGVAAAGANNFVLMDNLQNATSFVINGVTPASQGGSIETIDSIKFQAPKSYAAQGRAVTENDYKTILQQNNLGISFDSVSVWGGEQNTPPVYGQVFISLKPAGAFDLTTTQKQRIVSEVLAPVSVLTVTPTLVDPDYTYIKLAINVYYNPNRTLLTSSQIQAAVISAVYGFSTQTLNTFNATFNAFGLLSAIQGIDNSIITSEYTMNLQKKIYPTLTVPSSYQLNYNTPLKPGIFLSGVSSLPAFQVRDPSNPVNIIDGVFIEEVPAITNGIDSLSIINPGFNYQLPPIITILGDGTGATAHSLVSGGSLSSIVVDKSGTGYTSALAIVTPQPSDKTGKLGAVIVNLQGQFGTLRTYFNDSLNVKTILNSNVGSIDYVNGVINLKSLNIVNVDNPLGQLAVSATPTTSAISSTFNSIITIDPFDNTAVVVNVIAKSS